MTDRRFLWDVDTQSKAVSTNLSESAVGSIDEDEKAGCQTRLMALYASAFFYLFALSVIIMLSFGLFEEQVGAVSYHDREKSIRDILISKGVADQPTLTKEGTPQSKALRWLATEDRAMLEVNDNFLPQRYALAVLYLETYEDGGWERTDNWLSGEGYCDWHGVICADETDYIKLKGNTEVFQLNLTNNELKGTIPTELGALSLLFQLDLQGNHLHGSIPIQLSELSNLRSLSLKSNNIGGSIPREMWSLRGLHVIDLQDNKIEGGLVSDVRYASNLRSLALSRNLLTGPIPQTLTAINKLENLYLGGNEFSGVIPSSLYELTRLEELELYFNRLEGTLSTCLVQLSHLELLALQGNHFEGKVPDVFQEMDLLESLHLQNNKFTGTIPLSISNMQRLQHFSVESNPGLGGTMPTDVCTLATSHKLVHLSVDCSNTSEVNSTGVTCSCCTDCY